MRLDISTSNAPPRHRFSNNHLGDDDVWTRSEAINVELKAHGAVAYDLLLPETHYLPFIIHPNEHIKGSVYGKYSKGRGALVATDKRVLFVDKKPLFVHVDEISYTVIGGVTRTQTGLSSIVTLHTPMGDYGIRTFNRKNALNFVDYIEAASLRHKEIDDRFRYKYLPRDNEEISI